MKTPDPLPAGMLGTGLRAIWVTHGGRRTLEWPTGLALLLSASLWSHVTDVSNQTRRGCGRKLPQSPHHSTPLSAVTLCGSHCDWPCAAALLPILSGLKCKCSSPALLGSVTTPAKSMEGRPPSPSSKAAPRSFRVSDQVELVLTLGRAIPAGGPVPFLPSWQASQPSALSPQNPLSPSCCPGTVVATGLLCVLCCWLRFQPLTHSPCPHRQTPQFPVPHPPSHRPLSISCAPGASPHLCTSVPHP